MTPAEHAAAAMFNWEPGLDRKWVDIAQRGLDASGLEAALVEVTSTYMQDTGLPVRQLSAPTRDTLMAVMK